MMQLIAKILDAIKHVASLATLLIRRRDRRQEKNEEHNSTLKQGVKDAFKSGDPVRIARALSQWNRLRKR